VAYFRLIPKFGDHAQLVANNGESTFQYFVMVNTKKRPLKKGAGKGSKAGTSAEEESKKKIKFTKEEEEIISSLTSTHNATFKIGALLDGLQEEYKKTFNREDKMQYIRNTEDQQVTETKNKIKRGIQKEAALNLKTQIQRLRAARKNKKK